MSATLKPPTFARYERVRSYIEREPYFQARLKGKPVTLVKPDGVRVDMAAETVGITNYLHANANTDVMALSKRVIVDTASALIENGLWKKHMPTEGRVLSVAVGKGSVEDAPSGAEASSSGAAPKAPRPRKRKAAAESTNPPTAAASDKPNPRKSRKAAASTRKAASKKSEAPTAPPQAAEPRSERGHAEAPEPGPSTSETPQPTPESPEPAVASNTRKNGEPDGSVPEEAPRGRLNRKPVPPQYEWAIPVISLLVGAEQILEAHDRQPGADGRTARLRDLTEDFQRILENRGRAETRTK